MFWDVLREGGDILLHWRFWAVTLSYGALNLIPLVIVGLLLERQTAIGCVAWIVAAVVWPVVILTGAVLLLTPLMVFRANVIAWNFLQEFSIGQIAIIGGVAFVGSLVLALVPIVGRFHSIGNFVQVALMLGIVTYLVTGGTAEVWPGWLMVLGLAVAGGIAAHGLGLMLTGPIVLALGQRREALAGLVASPLGALASLVPACFYAGWLRVANGF